MTIIVNGEKFSADEPLNIDELLIATNAEQPEYVTVQLNGEFVEREKFSEIFIRDGDSVEFLYFMGGGQLE